MVKWFTEWEKLNNGNSNAEIRLAIRNAAHYKSENRFRFFGRYDVTEINQKCRFFSLSLLIGHHFKFEPVCLMTFKAREHSKWIFSVQVYPNDQVGDWGFPNACRSFAGYSITLIQKILHSIYFKDAL